MKFLLIFIICITVFTGCTNNTNEQINYETREIKEPQKIFGSFSTKITDKTPERLNNINLGIKKLNGVTIEPNEEFSFNDQIGPRTPENGFEKSAIFSIQRLSGRLPFSDQRYQCGIQRRRPGKIKKC